MKKLIVLMSSILLLSSTVFAQKSSMQDRTENWTKESPMTRGAGNAGGDNEGDTPGIPAGNPAWVFVLGLAVAYGAFIPNKRRKRT
ncbi:MAG: hypothetical protein LBH12_03345 [Dysgonamonadaceae bacterium]|jgi:hypothetical protein|nr:hypothetical protein [Dysgonamonadaceae bacterium]